MFRSSSDWVQLQQSEKDLTKGERFGCNYCEDGYYSETEVEVHKQRRHMKQLLALKKQTGEKTKLCLICTEGYASQSQLVAHVKSAHLLSSKEASRVEWPIFICDFCSVVYFNKLLLELHILARHIQRPKKCNTCLNPKKCKTCLRPKTCKTCPHCGKTIKILSIYFHLESCRMKSVRLCPVCLEKLQSRLDLPVHIKKHTPLYTCNICGYQTLKVALFRKHVGDNHKSHSDIPLIPNSIATKYFVPKCDSGAYLNWRYSVPYISNGLKLHCMLYICVLCQEICENVPSMQWHITVDHMSYKPVVEKREKQCSCGKIFNTEILLKQHLFKSQMYNANDHYRLIVNNKVLKEKSPEKEFEMELEINTDVKENDETENLEADNEIISDEIVEDAEEIENDVLLELVIKENGDSEINMEVNENRDHVAEIIDPVAEIIDPVNDLPREMEIKAEVPTRVLKKKPKLCSCGETFFNEVLLKQHLLKAGDNHNVVKEFDENIT